MVSSARSRRLRWTAPFATAAVIALIVAVPGLSAATTPTLAAITPAQLIAKVQQTKVTALSGTLDLNTNLGIPDLSALSNAAGGGGQGNQAFSLTDLLAGSHQARVWFDGPDKARVALLENMAETDVVHNGNNVWTWDSTTKKVTHYTITPRKPDSAAGAKASSPADAIKTPQQVADNLLAHLDPSTTVSVGTAMDVAGQKSYQLILTPHSSASTVDHVAIAVDSVTGLPLQVQVFAKGQKSAAVKLGFGSISYSTPAASEFNFTPPPGSTVTNGDAHPAAKQAPAGLQTTPPPPAKSQLAHGGHGHLVHVHRSGPMTLGPMTSGSITTGHDTTVGKGWTAVDVIDNVQIPAQFSQYLSAATPVSGAFGAGKLLETSLVNILVLDNGRVAIGAVSASALEAAIAAAPAAAPATAAP